MSINVANLPTERKIVAEGPYLAEITNCRCRVAGTGNNTLNFQLKTSDGSLWDQITESQNENALYKVQRLLEATGVLPDLPPEVELEDIAIAIADKKVGIVVIHQPDQQGNMRAVVAFRDPIFWSETEFAEYQQAAREAQQMVE